MKRRGYLLEDIATRENLRLAFSLAVRGRRQNKEVRRISQDLEGWSAQLRREVLSGEVPVGSFEEFVIHEPKRRVISAAPFRERVLHHAIINVIGSDLERGAIPDSYACRPGKGPQRARERAQAYSRRFSHFGKLDIRRYFDSVSHAIVAEQFARRFKDAGLLLLLDRITQSYQTAPGRGLPIGSLISQYTANAFLGPLDRFIRESLRARGYVRYMDDIVVWHQELETLDRWRVQIEEFLRDRLLLELNPKQVFGRSSDGLPFLGTRITPWAMYPSRCSRRRLVRKIKENERSFSAGVYSSAELQRRASSLLAAVAHTRCREFRRRFLLDTAVDP